MKSVSFKNLVLLIVVLFVTPGRVGDVRVLSISPRAPVTTPLPIWITKLTMSSLAHIIRSHYDTTILAQPLLVKSWSQAVCVSVCKPNRCQKQIITAAGRDL